MEVVGWVRNAIINLDCWHLKSFRYLDGKDFIGKGLTRESLNVLVGLAESLDLLIDLVYTTHKVVNVDLAPRSRVLVARIGVGLTIFLFFMARVTSDVVDINSDGLGYEDLHILHDVGLDEVHLCRVNDYWLGVGIAGIFVTDRVDWRDGWWVIFSCPWLWWRVAGTGVVVSYVCLVSLSIRVSSVGTLL